jgi:hypothetical protein
MMPPSTSVDYRTVSFAIIYCFFNVCFGVFLLISSALWKNGTQSLDQDHRETEPTKKLSTSFKVRDNAIAPSIAHNSTKKQPDVIRVTPADLETTGQNNYKLTAVIDKLTEGKAEKANNEGRRSADSTRTNNILRVSRLDERKKSMTPAEIEPNDEPVKSKPLKKSK